MIAELSAPRLIKTVVNELAFDDVARASPVGRECTAIDAVLELAARLDDVERVGPAALVDGHVVGVGVGEGVAQERASLEGSTANDRFGRFLRELGVACLNKLPRSVEDTTMSQVSDFG